jgi:hypothetical protein
MSSPQHRRAIPIVLAGILALVVVIWIAKTSSEPEVTAPEAARHEPGAKTAREQQPLPDRTNEPRTAVATSDPTQPAAASVLRVRLRGLHPKAPWTAPLHLDVDGRVAGQWLDHDAQATPDAEGRCSLPLPSWYHTATDGKGRIVASDPHYRALQHRWEGTLDPAQELVLDVQVVAIIEGRVVDLRDRAVPAAGICAFAIRDGEPTDPILASAGTDEEGRYRLGAPPDVPLLLVAVPIKAVKAGRYETPQDLTAMRSDLLPVTRRIACTVGVVSTADFALPDATPITGVVRWSNGTPVATAAVGALRTGRVLEIGPLAALRVLQGGAVQPMTQTETDERGQFNLPGMQGTPVDVRVMRLPGALLLDDLPAQTTVPPQPCELGVPLPIKLRVLHAGVVVPHAEIDLERTVTRAGDNGEFAIVTTRPLRAQASHEQLQSPWTEIDPRAAGTTIELELAAALGEVAIEFEGDFRVRNTVITWRSEDGREGREHLLRDDRSGPFRLFVQPGRYHLTAGPGGGERNGVFLLPSERDVEVGAVPRQITFPSMFGGRFTVLATDSSGLYVGGTCRVVDASGKDVTDRFSVRAEGRVDQGAPGELLPGGPNDFTAILPAGDYLLTFDFRDHGAREHRVSIKQRDVAEVRVRL